MLLNFIASIFIPTSSRILDGFFAVGIFIFGACIGSFLNCIIYRLEAEKSLKGRSFCPHCKHMLGWQDLFPIFSFLFLRGKCRYCREKISIQYPIVEISTALIFLLIFIYSYSRPIAYQLISILYLFYISSSLIIIFIYDLKHYIIPDKILFPAIIITVFFRIFEFEILDLFGNWKLEIGNLAPLGNYLLAVIVASGFFLSIFLVSKGKWMGFGDVKLAVLMGLLLGFPNILSGLFLAFLFGAIIGIILMVFKQKGLKSEIPFGPFLIAGTFISIFWGSLIVQWYMSLIGAI